MSTFESLGLIEPLCRALTTAGYERPTPIQHQAIGPLLDGRDVLGCAQTGTGKTAAFALPVLQHLVNERPYRGKRRIRALVLTPTRELAAQIAESFTAYGRYVDVKHQVIFGGVNENPQIRALRAGFDVLVATPGRLLDLTGRGYIDLGDVDFFVLDEADRMLDMGFVHDVRRVIRELPEDRQNLLFSATMPPEIIDLAGSFLDEPVKVEVTPSATTVERIEQRVMFVERADKKHLLADLLQSDEVDRALVFTRTKHGANQLCKKLEKASIRSAAIHGNKSQGARTRALDGFRSGAIPVLVATDIASRGIDVDGVSHVFNYDLPNEPEVYVHRIGRTGRAGRSGIAISLCDATEAGYLRAIERIIGQQIPVDEDHEYHVALAMPPRGRERQSERSERRGGGGGGGGGRRRNTQRPRGRSGPRRDPRRADPRRADASRTDASRTDASRSDASRSNASRSNDRRSTSEGSESTRSRRGASSGSGSRDQSRPSGERTRDQPPRRRRRRPGRDSQRD